ncbi:serine protease [Saccharomonospora sp. NPDC046836]|uniref:S1 family peptidase n=1 Tax=Saccharomonospora sp. NPDC046836 TaxID=3156921 RepID=UPI0033DCA96C
MRRAMWSRIAAVPIALLLLALGIQPAFAAQRFIIGGTGADEDYPFMASLQLTPSGQHLCGGSLIAPTWIVTAAHCVQGRATNTLTARIGSSDRTQGGEVVRPAQFIVHPDYNPAAAGADIALVRLSTPVDATPIELGTETSVGTQTRLLGWGQTCPTPGCGTAPVMLRQLQTTILAAARCTAAFNPSVELCTNNPGGNQGACYGDSGGPQITPVDGRWRLLGITSRPGNQDTTCATGPTIYTSAVAYTDWINEHVEASPA